EKYDTIISKTNSGELLENEKAFQPQDEFMGNTGSNKPGQITGKRPVNEDVNKIIIEKNQPSIKTSVDPADQQKGSVKLIFSKNEKLLFYPVNIPFADQRATVRVAPTNNILPHNQANIINSTKSPKLKKESSFSTTAFFGPNISSSRIIADRFENRPGSPPPHDNHEKIRKGEKPQSSETFGVLIDYKKNRHWGLQSGVALYNKTISIDPKTIYAGVDNNGQVKYLYNCSSGYLFLSSKSVVNPAVGDSINAFMSTNTLQYVLIPLAIKYTYPVNKFDLFASIGTSAFILTKGKIETEIGNTPSNKEANTSTNINGLKNLYFGGNIGIGASYHISDKVAISFLPSYNFALGSGTKDAVVKSYPNLINLAAGISYKF
ncbi:MAG: hypothetical protein ABIS01_09720, partial [Ferruginibacter sp.]